MNENTLVEIGRLLADSRKFQEEDCDCGTCGKCSLSGKIYLMERRLKREMIAVQKGGRK